MGVCPARYSNIYEINPKLRTRMMDFDALEISQNDLGLFYSSFKEWEVDINETIEIIRLLMACNETSKFAIKVFKISGEKESTAFAVDFPQYVFGLWDFCTLTKRMLVDYLFNKYCKSKQLLTLKDANNMCLDIFGTMHNHISDKFYKFIDSNPSGGFTPDDMRHFVHKNPALLHTLYEFQTALREKTVSGTFWSSYIRRRARRYDEKYIPVADIVRDYRFLHDPPFDPSRPLDLQGGEEQRGKGGGSQGLDEIVDISKEFRELNSHRQGKDIAEHIAGPRPNAGAGAETGEFDSHLRQTTTGTHQKEQRKGQNEDKSNIGNEESPRDCRPPETKVFLSKTEIGPASTNSNSKSSSNSAPKNSAVTSHMSIAEVVSFDVNENED